MIRSLGSCLWHVHSPSLFELVSDRPERVYIIFDGAGWSLTYMAEDGHTVSRGFKSRDAAIGLIAGRMQA